jgi:C1A family cysteine protease
LLKRLDRGGDAAPPRPTSVDLREYFAETPDQLSLNASSAHACAGLYQYFERRAQGRLTRPAPLFLYQTALRLAGSSGNAAVDLRTTLKAMILCGIPPERYWPYAVERLDAVPDAFLYSFHEAFRGLRYVRLDGRKSSGGQNLQTVKGFLAGGFPAVFGFAVPNTLETDGNIPFRPTFDAALGGQAMIAVGYDDRWLRGSRGALLVRSSWGETWGEAGYGWLPYAYVEERLALDFFTLVHPHWIDSGEFEYPLTSL